MKFFTKIHLGHGPGFVGKYVLDLSEFFVQRRGPSFGRVTGLFVEHFFVPVYEKTLHETYYFDTANILIISIGEKKFN